MEHFQILSPITKTAHSSIFLVKDKKSNELFAMKQLNVPDDESDEEFDVIDVAGAYSSEDYSTSDSEDDNVNTIVEKTSQLQIRIEENKDSNIEPLNSTVDKDDVNDDNNSDLQEQENEHFIKDKMKRLHFKFIQNEIQALQIIQKGPNIYNENNELNWPFNNTLPKKINNENIIPTFMDNICNLKKVIENEKEHLCCLILEYANVGDLFTVIEYFDNHGKNGRMTESQARFFFKQIVNGVLYLHRCGICHRDLKPENILVHFKDKNAKIYFNENYLNCKLKITDFGFCGILKKSKEITLFNELVGTESWVAPEVLNKELYDGLKADIWSLGCILYSLLTGCFAFDHDNFTILSRMIRNVEIVYPKFLTIDTIQFLQQMICKNPNQRLTVEEIYEHPWMNKD
ncbi:hypothetical protein ABK040_000161 [Willaertia magna]